MFLRALDSDSGESSRTTAVHANHTVTFTAPKPCQVLSPACELAGKVHVAPIGSPPELYEKDPAISLALSEPATVRAIVPAPGERFEQGPVRARAGDRGRAGKNRRRGDGGDCGAARGSGPFDCCIGGVGDFAQSHRYAPEIMTEPLAETDDGSIAMRAPDDPALTAITEKKTVIAIGPGMGQHPETVQFIRRFVQESKTPMVVDADALNALAGQRLAIRRAAHSYAASRARCRA